MSNSKARNNDLVRRGRLVVASNERVISELERYGDIQRASDRLRSQDDQLEIALLNRNDPEIDLSLARNAGMEATLKVLYTRASADPSSSRPESYLKALRLSVLSNECGQPSGLGMFPRRVIDDKELRRIAIDKDRDEAIALFTNIRLDEKLIVALLTNKEPFNDLDDPIRRDLINIVGRNPRWSTRFDGSSIPDLAVYRMYRAAVHMLRNSPVDSDWLRTLYEFVLSISPFEAFATDDSVEDVLERWKGFEVDSGRQNQGRLTSLSLADEFRCLVAACFPRYREAAKNSGSEQRYLYFGNKKSQDPAYRAAYFATCKLSRKFIREHTAIGGDGVFNLSVLSNSDAYSPQVRKIIEERCIAGIISLYARRLEQYSGHSSGPQSEPLQPLTEWVKHALQTESAEVQENPEIRALAHEVSELKSMISRQQKSTSIFRTQFMWIVLIFAVYLALAAS